MLDRDAGRFRLAPGRRARAGRPPLPARHDGARDELGHARGWIIVRDVAAHRPVAPRGRPLRAPTGARPPTTTPTTCLLRTVRCVNGEVQVVLDCEPMFDYGRARATWEYDGRRLPRDGRPRAAACDLELRLTTDLHSASRARAPPRAHLMKAGEALFCALSWSEHAAAAHVRRGLRAARLDRPPLAALARPRQLPRPPVALRPPAQRAHAQGPDLRAHRRDRRRRRRRRCPRRPGGERNWDYRYAWIRDSTFALWGLYTLGFDWEANDFFYFVADVDGGRGGPTSRSCTASTARRPARAHARPPVGLRERAPGARRQRRVRAAPARRVGRGARLALPPHPLARPPARALLADAVHAGRGRPRRTGATRTAASGRCAASRSTSRPRS